MEKVNLEFDDDALDYIVEKAIEFKLGARGLRSLCETIMLDAMYDMPTQKSNKESTFTVTRAFSESKITMSDLQRLRIA